jgi:hypothetical protein
MRSRSKARAVVGLLLFCTLGGQSTTRASSHIIRYGTEPADNSRYRMAICKVLIETLTVDPRTGLPMEWPSRSILAWPGGLRPNRLKRAPAPAC